MRRSKPDDTQSLLAARALRKLSEVDESRIAPFLAHYVEGVTVRPLLTSGMFLIAKNPAPAAPDRRFLILIDDSQGEEQRAVTLFHELIHVFLVVVGIDSEHHDEDQIEARAVELARRIPGVMQIAAGVFPNLAT